MSELAGTKKPLAWFVSARTDQWTLLVAGPLVSLVLLMALLQGPAFLVGAMLFALFLDLPHVLHTHVRLLANPGDYLRHRRQYWSSLLAITLLCLGLALAGQFLWLLALWVYWQPYHVCKQHFGVATMYARKSGFQGDTRPLLCLLLAGFAAPILYRMAHGGLQFGDYAVFGQPLPFAHLQIPAPALPEWIAGAAYGVFALSLGYWLWRERQHAATPAGALPGFVRLQLAVALLLYNAAYLFVSDLYALILIGTSIHALQYHLVCMSSIKSLLPNAPMPPESSRLLRRLHRGVQRFNGTFFLWLTLITGSGLLLATEIPSFGIVPLIVVLHHFYLDGIIWKRKASP